jgi:oligosaccharide repeat unit polymerase
MNQAKRINLSIIFFSFIILFISFFYNYNYSFFLLIPSFLILLITSFPILISNEHNVFSPLNYLIYFIFLNLFLRNIYIIYDYPSKSYVDGIFLLYDSKDLLIKAVLLTLMGFIFFTLGYLFYSYKPFVSNKKPVIWNSKKLNLLSFILSFISFISLIKFIISSKVNLLLVTLQTFSNYRGVSEDLSDYNANGFLRVLIQLSLVVFYINYIHFRKSQNKTFSNKFYLIFSFLITLLFFFFTQSRSGVMFLFINCFLINYYLNNYKFSYKRLLVLFPILVLFFSFMTSLRGGSGFDLKDAVQDSLFSVLDPLVANNGGIDTSKTAHIMNYVDKHNDFKYGSGYLFIFSSFIPRAIWPNKPVNIDTEVGMKVYNATSYGTGAVPPGLIAESYWNFGYLGILIIPFIVGIFTRRIHNYFKIINNDNNKILLYVVCFIGVPYSCFGSSITSALIGLIYLLVPLYLSLKYISKI